MEIELPDPSPMRRTEGDAGERPRASLIIAVYQRIDFLRLVLQSVANQSYQDIEVIIAEDDHAEEMRAFICDREKDLPFPIKHVCQEDRGFRKNRILNQAIRASESDYLIFVDGDCILHHKFVQEHLKRSRPGTCLFGRRAMLSKKFTDRLLRADTIEGISFPSLVFQKTRRLEDGLYLPWMPSFRKFGVKGCNFSLHRDLINQLNGFDEDFEKPFGGEDTDIERRLRLVGCTFECTKFKTIQYHLYHGGRENREKEWETEGKAFYQNKINEGVAYCQNGLLQAHRRL